MTQHYSSVPLEKNGLPASETHAGWNMLGVALACIAFYLLRNSDVDTFTIAICSMVSGFLPIFLSDLFYYRIYRKPTTGLGEWRKPDHVRVAIKWLGLSGIYAAIFLLYWLFAEYHKPFYTPFFRLAQAAAPFLLIFSVPYVYFVDGWQKSPEDVYYRTGRMLMGKTDRSAMRAIAVNFRNWLVKAFFLPLMFIFLMEKIEFLTHFSVQNPIPLWQIFEIAFQILYFVDVVFGTLGYITTFTPLDSHIRSSEPTLAGWLVAIICYPPFIDSLLFASYLNYHDSYEWGSWLYGSPILYFLWGQVLVVLLFIYTLATVCFGYRFSNLTYRGLISNGPYAWTKHPAYAAKNISWWMISIPFIATQGYAEAVRQCLLLAGVNLIYYFRAITEERHLSRYPEYVAYALAMNEKSIFAPVARLLPFLKYRAPESVLAQK